MFGLKAFKKNNSPEQIFFVYKCLGLKDSKKQGDCGRERWEYHNGQLVKQINFRNKSIGKKNVFVNHEQS
jgi:hypothetical protein